MDSTSQRRYFVRRLSVVRTARTIFERFDTLCCPRNRNAWWGVECKPAGSRPSCPPGLSASDASFFLSTACERSPNKGESNPSAVRCIGRSHNLGLSPEESVQAWMGEGGEWMLFCRGIDDRRILSFFLKRTITLCFMIFNTFIIHNTNKSVLYYLKLLLFHRSYVK